MWKILCALLTLTLTSDPVTSEAAPATDCVSVVTIHAGKNLFGSGDNYTVDLSLWYNMVKFGETNSMPSQNPNWDQPFTLQEKIPTALLYIRMVANNKIKCDLCRIKAGDSKCSFCRCKINLLNKHVLYSYECKPRE